MKILRTAVPLWRRMVMVPLIVILLSTATSIESASSTSGSRKSRTKKRNKTVEKTELTDWVQVTLSISPSMRRRIVDNASRAGMCFTAYCQAAIEIENSNWSQNLGSITMQVYDESFRVALPTAKTNKSCPCEVDHLVFDEVEKRSVSLALSMTRQVRARLKRDAAERGLSLVDYVTQSVLVEQWNYEHRHSRIIGCDKSGAFELMLLYAELTPVRTVATKLTTSANNERIKP